VDRGKVSGAGAPGEELLIVAALGDELDTALDLCGSLGRLSVPGIRAWRGERSGHRIAFLKAGVGPVRSRNSLERFLARARPRAILALGYGGALREGLRVGDLVAVGRASLLRLDASPGAALEGAALEGTWPLEGGARIHERARLAGLAIELGDSVTSSQIIGTPADKRLLYRRFGASIVDMETGALARAAAEAGVALDCVRAVSDEVEDDFLAPLSYDPAAGPAGRAARLLAAGRWIRRYRDWRSRAERARGALRDFMAWYLDCPEFPAATSSCNGAT
jgi:nucleoside phosphorylase